jgi:tryptophan-rich sensory protein
MYNSMKKYFFLICTLITVFINSISSFNLINNVSVGQLSAEKFTLITPSGSTFAIWSVIYLGLIAIGVGIAMGRVKIDKRTNLLYFISCLTNCLWIFAWQYRLAYIPFLLLVSIMIANYLVANRLNGIPKHLYLIYASWTVIATVLNAIIFFQYDLKIDKIGDINNGIIGVILLTIGVMIYILTSYKYQSISPLLVGAWAYNGIYAGQQLEEIKSTSLIYCVVMLFATIPFIYKTLKKKKHQNSSNLFN